jgi:hypothetical protein
MSDVAPCRLHTSVATTVVRSAARPVRKMGDMWRQVSWLAARALVSDLPNGPNAGASVAFAEQACRSQLRGQPRLPARMPNRVPFSSPASWCVQGKPSRAHQRRDGCSESMQKQCSLRRARVCDTLLPHACGLLRRPGAARGLPHSDMRILRQRLGPPQKTPRGARLSGEVPAPVLRVPVALGRGLDL